MLKNAVFEEILPTGTEDVWAYRFSDTITGSDIYALWCPTSDGTAVPNYILQTEGGVSAAAVYPEDQKAAGTTQLLQLDNAGRTAVNVSETPVFVVVNPNGQQLEAPRSSLLPATYHGHQTVTLTAPEGSEIYYTTDYSEPTRESDLYISPLTVDGTQTIKAAAFQNGAKSITAVYPYNIRQLPLHMDGITLLDVPLDQTFGPKLYEYRAVVAAETSSVVLTVDAQPHISLLVNGEEAAVGMPVTLPLQTGINRFVLTAVQNETGEELEYILDVTRKSDPPYEIIRPAGSGQAAGSRHMPLGSCFDGEVSLDVYDNPVCESSGKDFGVFADGVGYIDFGEDFENVRITSVWTLYRAYASYAPGPLTNLWWDDDIDCINDSGDTESQLIFASVENLRLGNQMKWFMDGQYDDDPVVPRSRYLMMGVNNGDARFVAELAFVGYIVTP